MKNQEKNIKKIIGILSDALTGKEEIVGYMVYYKDAEPVYIDAKLGEKEKNEIRLTNLEDRDAKKAMLLKKRVDATLKMLLSEIEKFNVQSGLDYDNLINRNLLVINSYSNNKKALKELERNFKNEKEKYIKETLVKEKKEQKKKSNVKKGTVAAFILTAGAITASALFLNNKISDNKNQLIKNVKEATIDDGKEPRLEFSNYDDFAKNSKNTIQRDFWVKVHDTLKNINGSQTWMNQTDENGVRTVWYLTPEELSSAMIAYGSYTEEEVVSIYNATGINPEIISNYRASFDQKMVYYYNYDRIGSNAITDVVFEGNEKSKAIVKLYEQKNALINTSDLSSRVELITKDLDSMMTDFYEGNIYEGEPAVSYTIKTLYMALSNYSLNSNKVRNSFVEKDDLLQGESEEQCTNLLSKLENFQDFNLGVLNKKNSFDQTRQMELINLENLENDRVKEIESMKMIASVKSILDKSDDNYTINAITSKMDNEFYRLTNGAIDPSIIIGFINEDLEMDKYANLALIPFTKNGFEELTKNSQGTTKVSQTPVVTVTTGAEAKAKVDASPALTESAKKQIAVIEAQNAVSKAVAEETVIDLQLFYQNVATNAETHYRNNLSGEYVCIVTSDEAKAGVDQGMVNQIISDTKAEVARQKTVKDVGGEKTPATNTVEGSITYPVEQSVVNPVVNPVVDPVVNPVVNPVVDPVVNPVVNQTAPPDSGNFNNLGELLDSNGNVIPESTTPVVTNTTDTSSIGNLKKIIGKTNETMEKSGKVLSLYLGSNYKA